MEPVWNGLLTCDYERTRPGSTRLEWDLYTRSLITWPTALMDDPTPYGYLRRPGIVDVPQREHERLLTCWHALLADPDYVRDLAARATARQHHTHQALDSAEAALARRDTPAAARALAEATSAFLQVMSTHIVNWLLPEQEWEDLLAELFGDRDRDRARACALTLATPAETGHILGAHEHLLAVADAVRHGKQDIDTAAADIAARSGTLYGTGSPAAAAMPMEDPARAAELLAATACGDTGSGSHAMAAARHRALEVRDAWSLAAHLAATGNPPALEKVRAMVLVTGWAAGSEERRKELRHRYLAAVRRHCEQQGTDATHITARDLLALRGAAQ